MALLHDGGWTLARRVSLNLDRALSDAFAPAPRRDADTAEVTWLPSVDVQESADKFLVRADLPGVEPEAIEITAENGVLTLRGERRALAAGEGFTRRERVAGAFSRRFVLPDTVDTTAITATHAHGVLEVTLPKQPKAEPRKIKVAAA